MQRSSEDSSVDVPMKSKFRQLCVSFRSCISRPCWLSSFRFRFFPEACKIRWIKEVKVKKKNQVMAQSEALTHLQQDTAILRIICHRHQPKFYPIFLQTCIIYMLCLYTRWINSALPSSFGLHCTSEKQPGLPACTYTTRFTR